MIILGEQCTTFRPTKSGRWIHWGKQVLAYLEQVNNIHVLNQVSYNQILDHRCIVLDGNQYTEKCVCFYRIEIIRPIVIRRLFYEWHTDPYLGNINFLFYICLNSYRGYSESITLLVKNLNKSDRVTDESEKMMENYLQTFEDVYQQVVASEISYLVLDKTLHP